MNLLEHLTETLPYTYQVVKNTEGQADEVIHRARSVRAPRAEHSVPG